YESEAAFNRAFKRAFGAPPARFRAQARQVAPVGRPRPGSGQAPRPASAPSAAPPRQSSATTRRQRPRRRGMHLAHEPARPRAMTARETRMNPFWQDLKFGARLLAKRKGFAATAILTLALGIGATTAIFSALEAILFRALPLPEAGRLVLFSDSTAEGTST